MISIGYGHSYANVFAVMVERDHLGDHLVFYLIALEVVGMVIPTTECSYCK